jgi:hypothetical protein
MSSGSSACTGSALPMSGPPSLCWAIPSSHDRVKSLSIIGVFTPAGCTELTRMLYWARKFAYTRMMPTMPCLAAAYPTEPPTGAPMPTRPATELISTIDPPLPNLIIGFIATSTVL